MTVNALTAALTKTNEGEAASSTNTMSAVEQGRERKNAKGTVKPPSRVNAEQYSFWMDGKCKQMLKIMAIEMETTQQQLGVEMANLLLAKYKKPEIAAPRAAVED